MFISCILNIMDKKILYSYDNQGELQQYNAYVKMNIRAGFEVSDVSKRESMKNYLDNNFIQSRIYPQDLLHSDKPLPKDRLYFERKDICSTLKGNSCIFKFSSSSSILNFMKMIEDRATSLLVEVNNHYDKLQQCLKKIISYLSVIAKEDFSPKNMELSEILINLKNISIYILEDVIDGLIDILYTIKQLHVSFLYNIETNKNINTSILILINELNDLEKRMKEAEVAILFKKLSLDDYKEDTELDERIQEILELPEEEMHKELQSFLEEEIQSNLSEAIQSGNTEEEEEGEGQNREHTNIDDPNVVLITEDKEHPRLSVRMTIEFLEEELEKIGTLMV